MRVFFGFRHTQVREAEAGDHFAESAGQRLRRKHHGKRECRFVLRHRRHGDCRPRLSVEAIEIVERKDTRQLARAVGAIVEENHAVAIAHRPDRLIVGACDRRRLDEFVRDAGFVGLLNVFNGARRMRRAAANHRIGKFLYAVPPFVAIHAEITSAHRCHAARSRALHHPLELPNEFRAARG